MKSSAWLWQAIFCAKGEYMAANKIGAIIALDGEKEFRSAVAACGSSLTTLKSEMNLLDAQTEGNANSIETLRKKHDILSRTLQEQERKEQAIKSGLREAQTAYERVGNELTEYKEKLELAKQTLTEMESSSDTTEEALEQQRTTIAELSRTVERGETTYQRAERRVQNWQNQLNNAETQTIRTTRALNENAEYMEEAERATDQCATSIDRFGQRAQESIVITRSWGESIRRNIQDTAFDAVKSLATDAFSSAKDGILELQSAQRHLQASTGATAKETEKYNTVMKELYSSGYGESVGDIANNMALVRQYTNETDPGKIKLMAENAMALQDVFDIDISEGIRAVDSMMGQMGLTADQAFDYIAAGAQAGLNKSGELTDNLTEYVSLWSQAGFSAEEMFAILDNGLDSGAYNLDKVNDFVKEFGNSMADGRIQENLSEFSKETENLFIQWKNGEVTTSQVFYSVISDLENMTNKQQALTIASNVWSSLGEDNAMQVIQSLNDVNGAFTNVKGTMESVKNIKYDDVSNAYKILGRKMQTDVVQPMLTKFLPAAQKGLETVTEHINEIGDVAKVAVPIIGGMFVVNKTTKFISELKRTGESIASLITSVFGHTAATEADTVAQAASAAAREANTTATAAQAAATTGATAAQTALNTSMLACPAVWVAGALMAVVGVAALISSGEEEATAKADILKDKTEELSESAKKAQDELAESTSNMKKSIDQVTVSGDMASGLIAELQQLSAEYQNTATHSGNAAVTQERMKTVVMQLNTMFPEMGLAIDEVTGKLNMSSEEMTSYIDAALEMQKVQAAQDAMKESVDKLVKAETEKYQIGEKLGEIDSELSEIELKRVEANEALEKKNKNLEKAQKEYSKALEEGAENTEELYKKTQDTSEATMEYNGEIMTVSEAMRQMAEDEESLNDSKKELETSQKDLNNSIKEANDEIEPYTEYLNNMTGETEKNTEATNANTEAKDANNQKAAVSIEVAGQELEAYKNLSVEQQELAVNVTNSVLQMKENVQSALESQMDMFEKFDGGTKISTETLLSNMQSQVDGVVAWEQNLSALADKGINQGILQKLAEMGPEGSNYVQAFNSMTDEELAKASELWNQSLDIKGMTNDWGQQLLESGATNIAGGMDALEPIMEQRGTNTVMGLVRGMENAQKTAETAGTTLGVKTIESIDSGLGCASPSKKTMASGRNVNQGLIDGMEANKGVVSNQAKTIATNVTNTIDKNLGKWTFITYGYRVSSGLAQGIEDGESKVINAATRVATKAIEAAKKTLDINSPSKVFIELGRGTMEGYVKGILKEEQSVRKTVLNALDFRAAEGKITGQSESVSQTRMIEKAVKTVMEKVEFKVILGQREVGRGLRGMGVKFNA